MHYVSIDEIIEIHDRIIGDTGGSLGIREPGLLAAISEKPLASFGGKDLYPTIYDKASAIFEAVCNYYVFIDGNKRTAIAVLEYFLFKNELGLIADKKQKEAFVLNTAIKKPALPIIAAWIKSHTKKTKR